MWWSHRPHRTKRAFQLGIHRVEAVRQQVDEELRFHFDQRIEALMARGLSRAAAEAQAFERFGPLESGRRELMQAAHAREETLIMRERLDLLRSDLAYVVRRLTRAPGIAITVVLTFALGIGTNATVFGVIDRLLLRPPPHVVDPDRLFYLSYAAEDEPDSVARRSFSYPGYRAIRDGGSGFAHVGVMSNPVEIPIGRGERANSALGQLVNAGYFAALGIRPVLGRLLETSDDVEPAGEKVVVISYAIWQRAFGGDPSVIGRMVDLGPRSYTIVGVTPRGFAGLGLVGIDLWIPVAAADGLRSLGQNWASSTGTWLRLIARPRPTVTPEQAAMAPTHAFREALPPTWASRNARIVARPVARNERAFGEREDVRVPMLVSAVSLVVLLVACVNVTNLLLVHGLRHERETAIRLALGVTRGRLVGQLVAESLILCAAGAVSALVMVQWGGAAFRSIMFPGLGTTDAMIDLRLIAYIVIVALPLALLTGLLPALQAGRTNLLRTMGSGDRAGTNRSRVRAGLLVAQAAMAVILLIGSGLFTRSLGNVAAIDLGFDPQRLLMGRMQLRTAGFGASEAEQIFMRIEQRVAAMPGVASVSLSLTVPFWSTYGSGFNVPGVSSPIRGSAVLNAVGPDYFEAMGTRIVSGRAFTVTDFAAAAPVVIIDELTARRYWPDGDAVGRCVKLGADTTPCVTIVGVAEYVRLQTVATPGDGVQVYVPLTQTAWPQRVLMVRTVADASPALVALVARTMQTAAPNLPHADVRAMKDVPDLAAELRPWRLGATMFLLFGVLALLLAIIGLYGVVMHGVTLRAHEMGVRIALGANKRSIIGLTLWHGLRPAAAGAAIGAVIALLMAPLLRPLLFETSPRDATTFALALSALLASAAAACLIPAWRASCADPLLVMRNER